MIASFEKQDSHDVLLSKRDQFAVEIRKKKTNELINLKRLRYTLPEKTPEGEKNDTADLSNYTTKEVIYFRLTLTLYLSKSAFRLFSKTFK